MINTLIDQVVNTELVIDVKAEEVVIALLKDKRLVELTTEKTSVKFAVGDIYYGKVKKIMPGLNAAFVNVGYEKDAFLHYLDLSPQFYSLDSYIKQCIARKGMPVAKLKLEPEISKNGKIGDVLSVGQYVAVQVAKEPISTKGPRLTSELSIAGRHLDLMPFSEKVSVSQTSMVKATGCRPSLGAMAKTTGASMATAATLESMPRRMMCVPTIMVRMACHQLLPTTQAWMWSASHWARPDWVMAVVMVMAPPSSRKVPQMVCSCSDFQDQGMRPGAKSTSMPSWPMTP